MDDHQYELTFSNVFINVAIKYYYLVIRHKLLNGANIDLLFCYHRQGDQAFPNSQI